ncbi:MAG TPA: ABC transporter substrate-binding protein [Flavobacteriales bacterium]|nr:ABC transporter substrate-binding protein [Flavobacteriales bacterium]
MCETTPAGGFVRLLKGTYILWCLAFFASCGSPKEKKEHDEGGEFKKHALNPIYAKGFTVYENETTIRLTSRNPDDTTQIYKVLEFSKKDLPFKKVAITSTTHAFLFDAIGANDVIKGMSAMAYLLDSNLKATYSKNGVIELGKDDNLNREVIVKLNPQILMVYPCPGCDYSVYEKAGITVVNNAEYMEQSPLGRAEWIKVAGLLSGRETEAKAYFKKISGEYYSLTNFQFHYDAGKKIDVILGKPIDNTWHVPGENSFAAKLIRDAGAHYVFEGVEGTNVTAEPVEWIIKKAVIAEFWVFTDYSQNEITIKNLVSQNKVYKALYPVQIKNVIVCNSAKDDFFGKAVIEPHILLKDLIYTFQGYIGDFPDSSYKPKYFKKIKEK